MRLIAYAAPVANIVELCALREVRRCGQVRGSLRSQPIAGPAAAGRRARLPVAECLAATRVANFAEVYRASAIASAWSDHSRLIDSSPHARELLAALNEVVQTEIDLADATFLELCAKSSTLVPPRAGSLATRREVGCACELAHPRAARAAYGAKRVETTRAPRLHWFLAVLRPGLRSCRDRALPIEQRAALRYRSRQ
jgi:hypothetical protein